MGSFVSTSIILTLVAAGLVSLIRRNLRQRSKARKLRDMFIVAASDLIGKPEFPEEHARQLVEIAGIPQGWLTRYMVFSMINTMIFGVSEKKRKADFPSFDQVPHNLRAKYVVAIFSLLLSDSYRCALLGRVVRGMHSWVFDALEEVKPDVDAHATRSVVNLVNQVHPPKRFIEERELACV